MALQGNLDDFSLAEILQLIAVQQKSGVLRLTSGEEMAVVFFEAGRIVSTRDRRRNAGDPLKPFLVRSGRISEAQLKQIETIEAESRRELTDILLAGNYLTQDQLARALEEQVQDTIHRLLTWKSGSYQFSGDARTVPKFAVNIRMNTEGLLMESMRRIDEMARFRETLSSPAMVLRPKALAVPPKEMTAAERRVLPLVDGLRPLRDILAQAKLVEFDVYEALYRLLDLGVIEVSLGAAPPKVTPLPVEALRSEEKPRSPVALTLASVALLASISFGLWVTPRLHAMASRFAPPPIGDPPAEILYADEVARLGIALDTYRRLRGVYPPDLETLGREGFLTIETARAIALRHVYTSDGATYTRVAR